MNLGIGMDIDNWEPLQNEFFILDVDCMPCGDMDTAIVGI